MYDLLIMSLLSTRDMSGYKLALVLGSTVVPRRKISNGVLYPVLSRLEKHGYIESIDADTRNAKIFHITPAGHDYLIELLNEPVAQDANRDNAYHFKFRSFSYLENEQRMEILSNYRNEILTDRNVYAELTKHYHDETKDHPDRADFYYWGIKTIQLKDNIAQTKLAWIEDCLTELKENDK
ncbi:putative transcriptional regulator, PadR family [Fructobacillus pseudoficulneus]|uniref:Putative transcriptional regulator, PadR family n=1 Tax=Fructobacillus pseudoficulneus TaxID=220714 RepID=A0A3F3GZM2_9LACO|nr:PadR family transcriptional regulator [Fructobacillus pseudoficulneus]GAP03407.1 putative transcriptional regulator, PadR family [Fructobacillus pseudoficulneus]SEH46314.1 DNA-binding transcriptional regulator, PadR family [Fructobacillus pseudoficulneus]